MTPPTNADLRSEIRDLLNVAPVERGLSQLRSTTLERANQALGLSAWGGAPSLRAQIRAELGLTDASEHDPSPFRKEDLLALRGALQSPEVDES